MQRGGPAIEKGANWNDVSSGFIGLLCASVALTLGVSPSLVTS